MRSCRERRMDPGTFETLCPSRYLTFSFPAPDPLSGPHLRVAVLDSPLSQPTDPQPRVAALLAPPLRHHDWLFSTPSGLHQLLSSSPSPLSRLILISTPSPSSAAALRPLLLALSPKSSFASGIPDIPFLSYEDPVLRSLTLHLSSGPFAGDMLVEDVEIAASPPELRRRLRFKRMPNLVQTQMRIASILSDQGGLGEAEFRPIKAILVQPYLAPMLASLALIAPYLDERCGSGSRPRALCLGAGGGALVSFLREELGSFDVLGVEIDGVVLRIAKEYFGLVEDEFCRIYVGDGIELIKNIARRKVNWTSVHGEVANCCRQLLLEASDTENSPAHSEIESEPVENSEIVSNSSSLGDDYMCGESNCRDFSTEIRMDNGDSPVDVIFVDLDSSDAVNGPSAPPMEFVRRSVLLAVRAVLHKHGVFAMNVIPRSESIYAALVDEFREVFSELYAIDVSNGENCVLIATASPVKFNVGESKSTIMEKLKGTLAGDYISQLRKI